MLDLFQKIRTALSPAKAHVNTYTYTRDGVPIKTKPDEFGVHKVGNTGIFRKHQMYVVGPNSSFNTNHDGHSYTLYIDGEFTGRVFSSLNNINIGEAVQAVDAAKE